MAYEKQGFEDRQTLTAEMMGKMEDGILVAQDTADEAWAAAKNMADPVPDYVRAEAERVANVVLSHQNENTLSFMAVSDMHYDSTNSEDLEPLQHAAQAMEIIRKRVYIDFAARLGDSTEGNGVTTLEQGQAEIMDCWELLQGAFVGLPAFDTAGNHDTMRYSVDQNGEIFTEQQFYALIGKHNAGMVLPDAKRSGGYCYRDFDNAKTRVICLNTVDIYPNASYNQFVSGEQLEWLAGALDLSGKDNAAEWEILLLSHHPLDWDGYINPALTLLTGYKAGVSGTVAPYGGDSISYDFTGKNAARVIGQVHGHLHNFKEYDMAAGSYAIKRLATPNACHTRNNEYGSSSYGSDIRDKFGDETTYAKTLNSAKDTAFCVYTIDRDAGIIYADHYGAGIDREVSYKEVEEVVTYTNVLPLATAYDSDAVYNGTGYKDGAYLSSETAPYEGTDEATFLTGYIPVTMGYSSDPPTFYVWGVEVDASLSHVRIGMFGSDKVRIGSPCSLSASNSPYAAEQLGSGYWKIAPVYDEDNSRWLVHHNWGIGSYFRFSLNGSGAGVIITVNEPID